MSEAPAFPVKAKDYETIAMALAKSKKTEDESVKIDDALQRGGYALLMLLFGTYGMEDGRVHIPPLDAALLAQTALEYVAEVEATWEES